MSASGGLPVKIRGQDGRATTRVLQARGLPNANMDVTEYWELIYRQAGTVVLSRL